MQVHPSPQLQQQKLQHRLREKDAEACRQRRRRRRCESREAESAAGREAEEEVNEETHGDPDKIPTREREGRLERQRREERKNTPPSGTKWSAVPLPCLTIIFQIVGFKFFWFGAGQRPQ